MYGRFYGYCPYPAVSTYMSYPYRISNDTLWIKDNKLIIKRLDDELDITILYEKIYQNDTFDTVYYQSFKRR